MKSEFFVSVEIIVFHNVLGGVCRSRREGQTEEDFRQEIFELIPATVALRKYSKNIFCKRSAFKNCLLTIFSSHPSPTVTGDTPLAISRENRFQHYPLFLMFDEEFAAI